MSKNEVKVDFIGDPKSLLSAADTVEKRVNSLNTNFNKLGTDLNFGKNFSSQADLVTRSLSQPIQKINALDISLKAVHNDLSKPLGANNFFTGAASQATLAAKSLRDYENQFDRTKAKTRGGFGNDVGQGLAGGFGVPLGTTAVVAAGVGVAVSGLTSLVDKSFEAEKAQRLLSSSATQAGLSMQFLGKESREFAKEGGLAQVNADKLTGQIARLTQAAGRPQDFDKVKTAVLDLASARGKSVGDLEPFLNAVITGSSDEPLNNFGLKDPGALQKDYALQVGKTTEALTQQENVLSRYNPFLETAAVNAGANADRLKSLSGQAELSSAKFNDLTTNLGKTITSSLEFRDGLKFVNDFLSLISINISDVQDKLAKGFKPKQIAEEEANKPGRAALNSYKNALSVIPASLLYLYDVPTKGYKEAGNILRESLTGARQRFIDDTTNLIEGQIKTDANQVKNANNQQLANHLKEINDGNTATGNALNKELSDLKSNARTFAELDAYRTKFKDKSYVLSVDDYNKNVREQAEVEAGILNKNFDRILGNDPNFDKIGKAFDLLDSRKKNLNDLDLSDSQDKLTKVFNTQLQTVKAAKSEFNDFLSSTKLTDNPFVKIFSDIDTVGERAEKRFKSLGKEAVNFAANAERTAANKKLNETRFDNNLSVLKLTQDARRASQLPLTQTLEFTRSLSSIERNVQHISDATDLRRKFDESSFYASQYNPNNPKSFNDSRFNLGEIERFADPAGNRRRGESAADFDKRRREAVDVGIKLFDSIKEIGKLNALNVGESGLYGQETIANRKLSLLPETGELLKRLSSPYGNVREDAQFALSQKADAFKVKRDAEEKRFNDSLDLQSFQDLRRKDYNEQINLLHSSTGLDKQFAAKNALSIAGELGVNNLDKQGRLDFRDASLQMAEVLRSQEREAATDRAERKTRDAKFDTLITNVTKLFGTKGLKVEIAGGEATTIRFVDDTTEGVKPQLAAAPSTKSTAEHYGDYQGALNTLHFER